MTSASGQPTEPSTASTASGTSTATSAGVTVCAKKYSISSTSWVATPTRSPVRRRVRYARAGAIARLPGHEPRVHAVAGDQLGVRAALHHAALVEHEDAVAADHARQAMREDERGAAGHQPIERGLDERLALGVHRRERLVE